MNELSEIKDVQYRELGDFLDATEVKQTTKDGYRRKLSDYMRWSRETNRIEPTAADIIQYKHHLVDRGLSPYTISAHLTAVRRFYSWAELQGLYPNIAREVHGAKTPRTYSRDSLTAKQAREVIDATSTPRERALILILLTTGLRSIEVIRADVGDFTTKSGTQILRVWGKMRDTKDDFVIVPDQTAAAIHDYLGTRSGLKDADPLFAGEGNRNRDRLTTRTIRRIVKNLYSAAGINSPRLTTHSTRHTTCTLAIQAGVPVHEVQQLARHRDISSTMVYVHDNDKLTAKTSAKVATAIFGDTE